MKQFSTIEKLDTGILYSLELASSVSVLLLAFGLIASMANVLTKGAILTDNVIMQRIWAVTQCVGIDAGMSGTIIRAFRFHAEGQKVKTWLYGLLSVLLLFTAAIVLNIESVQQTLNITLERAYIHVFVPVEVLIWIRSIAIVLLIVAHAMRHVPIGKPTGEQDAPQPSPASLITPELLDALRALLQQTSVSEEQTGTPLLLTEGQTQQEAGEDNGKRVKAYLADHPKATLREIAGALTISVTTARKWRSRVQGGGVQASAKK
jgi:hypothetical protein